MFYVSKTRRLFFEKLQKDVEAFQQSDLSKARDAGNLDSFEGMASALTGMSAYKTKTSQFSSLTNPLQDYISMTSTCY